ncbi:hypothetical protein RND71_021754 [Anisodus tanguticus]|uniref:Uncharacterized protein n=1 Tax=Anisodus tanguticus TaxID=243964 RepID=A0AAE1RX36_9SOLA|nr:hypothetical protein RND71_021754 [Anisodus tanguticus]
MQVALKERFLPYYRRGGASQSMGQRMLCFDFVSRDPPQVGFESRVMGDYPASLEPGKVIINEFPSNSQPTYAIHGSEGERRSLLCLVFLEKVIRLMDFEGKEAFGGLIGAYHGGVFDWGEVTIPEDSSPDHSALLPAPLQTPEHTQFLTQKFQMASMLAAAKNSEEMQAIILKFAPSSSKQGSSSKEEEPEIDIEDNAAFGNNGF